MKKQREAKQTAGLLPSRAAADAVAGAVSGAVSRFVIGPLDVLKIRFQVQLEPIRRGPQAGLAVSKYTGVAQAFRLILEEEGIQARVGRRPAQPLPVMGFKLPAEAQPNHLEPKEPALLACLDRAYLLPA